MSGDLAAGGRAELREQLGEHAEIEQYEEPKQESAHHHEGDSGVQQNAAPLAFAKCEKTSHSAARYWP
ncbi:MAG: hypothetical protein WDM79_04750 [Terricaulis sp.]